MSYEKALNSLYRRNEFSIKLGLNNIRKLLKNLNSPHHSFPAVHIAGTNGKGSVAAFISSVLIKEGYKVGLFTSPHLIDFRERIQVNHKMISRKEVLSGLRKIETVIKKIQRKAPNYNPTYFEIVTALAFKTFSDQNVDIAVLETGLGGRLDSTNVCKPIISIITNISRDHVSILGKSLKQIAYEKAGIIKRNVPVVIGEARKNRLEFLLQEAKKRNARILLPESNLSHFKINFEKLALKGDYQIQNALTALTALKKLKETDFDLSNTSIQKGLKDCIWPGRFQKFGKNPEVILDGAHNPDGIRQLGRSLKSSGILNPLMVFGLLKDKPIKEMVKKISQISNEIILVEPAQSKAMPLRELAENFRRTGFKGKLMLGSSTKEVLQESLTESKNKKKTICVCGSLYIVGEALNYFKRHYEKN